MRQSVAAAAAAVSLEPRARLFQASLPSALIAHSSWTTKQYAKQQNVTHFCDAHLPQVFGENRYVRRVHHLWQNQNQHIHIHLSPFPAGGCIGQAPTAFRFQIEWELQRVGQQQRHWYNCCVITRGFLSSFPTAVSSSPLQQRGARTSCSIRQGISAQRTSDRLASERTTAHTLTLKGSTSSAL